MPKEAIDYLEDRIAELQDSVILLQRQMTEQHKALSEKVSQLSDRVLRLEEQERITRWIFAAGGTLGGFLVREVLSRWF